MQLPVTFDLRADLTSRHWCHFSEFRTVRARVVASPQEPHGVIAAGIKSLVEVLARVFQTDTHRRARARVRRPLSARPAAEPVVAPPAISSIRRYQATNCRTGHVLCATPCTVFRTAGVCETATLADQQSAGDPFLLGGPSLWRGRGRNQRPPKPELFSHQVSIGPSNQPLNPPCAPVI